jgi:hypothetical protein
MAEVILEPLGVDCGTNQGRPAQKAIEVARHLIV